MKLEQQRIPSFISTGIVVMCVTLTCYSQQSSDSFGDKLKSDIIKKVREYAPTLCDGILKSPEVISGKESKIIQSIHADAHIVSIVYLNRTGKVRWHKEKRFIGATLNKLQKEAPLPTDALQKAYINKKPQVRQVSDEPLYELAIPLTVGNSIIGIIDITAMKTRKHGENVQKQSDTTQKEKSAHHSQQPVASWVTTYQPPSGSLSMSSASRSAERDVEDCYSGRGGHEDTLTPSAGPVGDTSYSHKELMCKLKYGSPDAREAAGDRLFELGASARGDIAALIDSALYNTSDRARSDSGRAVWSAGAGYNQGQFDEIFISVMPKVRQELESQSYKYKATAVDLIEYMMRRASLGAINKMFPEGPSEFIKSIDFGSQPRGNLETVLEVIPLRIRDAQRRQGS